MGFFDRFSLKSRFGKNRDFDINDKLEKMYGRELVVGSYDEILKLTDKKFKETLDLNDQILAKYAKKNKEDIQAKVMQQYLKGSQEDLLLEEQQLVENEVDEVTKDIDGVDKQTKEEIKRDLEEDKEGLLKVTEASNKKSKEALQKKIYEATYNRMYKDYAGKVMAIKNAQYSSMAIGLGTKEAVTIIAMEKNLEKLDLLYHNHTGKDIDNVKKIQDNKKEFKSDFEHTQRGLEHNTDDRSRRIEMLYKIRNEKYEKYIQTLKDPSSSPQEKYMLKKQYEEANLDLIQNIPSLEEYSRDIQIQGKNEDLAHKAHIEESAINSRIQNENISATRVTDSRAVDNIEQIREEEFQRDELALKHTQIAQKEAMDKGDFGAAREMDEASVSKRVYDRNIENIPAQSSVSETRKDVMQEEDRSVADFRASLGAVNRIEDKSEEELQNIVADQERDTAEKIRENMHNEQLEQNAEQRIRKQNKKPNG